MSVLFRGNHRRTTTGFTFATWGCQRLIHRKNGHLHLSQARGTQERGALPLDGSCEAGAAKLLSAILSEAGEVVDKEGVRWTATAGVKRGAGTSCGEVGRAQARAYGSRCFAVCVCVVTTKKDAIGDCEMLGDVLSRGVVVVSGVLSRRRTQQA